MDKEKQAGDENGKKKKESKENEEIKFEHRLRH